MKVHKILDLPLTKCLGLAAYLIRINLIKLICKCKCKKEKKKNSTSPSMKIAGWPILQIAQ